MNPLGERRGPFGPATALCFAFLVAVSGLWAGEGSTAPPKPVASRQVDDATIERLRKLHYSETEEVRLVLLPTSVTE